MDNKEFKQDLINEIMLNVKPSYYKNYELNVDVHFVEIQLKMQIQHIFRLE